MVAGACVFAATTSAGREPWRTDGTLAGKKIALIDVEGILRDSRGSSLLGVPEGFKAVSIVSIGHPARPHRPRPRLPIHALVFSEKWGEPYYEEQA